MQDLSCAYVAHHELESESVIIVSTVFIITIIVVMIVIMPETVSLQKVMYFSSSWHAITHRLLNSIQ